MRTSQQNAIARARGMAAWLTIAVLLLFASFEAAHSHLPGATEAAHCSFCLAAHNVAAIAVPATLPELLSAEPYRAAAAAPRPRFSVVSSNFIRPPPAEC